MLSNEDINNFFTQEKIDELRGNAAGGIFKYNRRIDVDTVINECYLYCIEDSKELFEEANLELNIKIKKLKLKKAERVYKRRMNLNTMLDLQKMSVNFINKNLLWDNSQLVIKHSVNSLHNEYNNFIDDDIELDNKIEIEKWYNEKMFLLQVYRQQETDREKQIIFDVYFKKGIIKGTDMAKHLKINKDYANKYIREMKKDIKDFIIKYNDK
jgi:hypothetical protein